MSLSPIYEVAVLVQVYAPRASMHFRPLRPPTSSSSTVYAFITHTKTHRQCLRRSHSSSRHSSSEDGWPHPVFSSDTLTHRKSGFQAHATHFTLPRATGSGAHIGSLVEDQLENVFAHIRKVHPRTKRATHRMWAYRCKDPSTSQASPSPSFASTQKAEKKSSGKSKNSIASLDSESTSNAKYITSSFSDVEPASGSILERLLELNHHSDVLVVVYRWYGGVKIGGERWRCISNVAVEALKELGSEEGSQSRK
ncbi:hypothetical protein BDY19DRAFT_441901 [Irpex rosettiformis]|uniref:Uncharacterized protein n=1 Tax=Irpex rosettiformis TaxID=378272 RepID=A0ACB8TU39_9APHY|nr:hypothetical protein BDY19DRAFT_441901 [Irpex rosettiformis]